MAIINCPECGHEVSDRAKICPHCGIEIKGQIMTCPKCGQINFKDAKNCAFCFSKLHSDDGADADKASEHRYNKDLDGQEDFKGLRLKDLKVQTTTVVTAVVFMIVVFIGLYFQQIIRQQNELIDYEHAMNSRDSAVLQEYLDVHMSAPSTHRDAVRRQLDKMGGITVQE